MSDATDRPGQDEAIDASVSHAGEPHGSTDTRDVTREEGVGPAPEDLDAREEAFTRPRKPMGPTERQDDVPETIPPEG
jgi:hypothetical protein